MAETEAPAKEYEMSEPMAPARPRPRALHRARPRPLQERLTVRELLEAGVHFGHQTRRWNPRMKPFLFGERNGVHIVDLDQTLPRLAAGARLPARDGRRAAARCCSSAPSGRRRRRSEIEAERAEQFYVNRRWLGGMLTNFKTVRKSIERFKELLELVGDEEKVGRALEEGALAHQALDREVQEVARRHQGDDAAARRDVRDRRGPRVDRDQGGATGSASRSSASSTRTAIRDSIDFVVPGNDDSLRAIQLYCARVADACVEGALLFNERVQAEVAEEERTRATGPAPEQSGTGQVVVEIKQQPRRGRGTHRRAARRGPSAAASRRDEAAEASERRRTGAPATE